MNRLPIFHDEKNFRDRSEQMFRDMQLQMDQDFMRGFGRPLTNTGSTVGTRRSWGSPAGFDQFDRDFFQLRPMQMHPPPPPSFPTATAAHLDQAFPAQMEVLDSKTVDNLFLEDPENKSRLFQMSFDVRDYDPQAVQVRVEDNCLIVEAKQGEIKDGGTKINKEFCRKIQLPPEVDPEKLTSTLSTDGVLSIKAPVPPRYTNIQSATAAAPLASQSFATTFKAPQTTFIPQQQQQQQQQPQSIRAEFAVPSYQAGGFPVQQASSSTNHQGQAFYNVPVLSTAADKMAVRDRPLFAPLGDGSGRKRMDLLVDLGRQYASEDVVVRFDDRSSTLTIEATREERDAVGGKTSRSQVSRQFELGERVEPTSLQAVMKGDGQLHVTAVTAFS